MGRWPPAVLLSQRMDKLDWRCLRRQMGPSKGRVHTVIQTWLKDEGQNRHPTSHAGPLSSDFLIVHGIRRTIPATNCWWPLAVSVLLSVHPPRWAVLDSPGTTVDSSHLTSPTVLYANNYRSSVRIFWIWDFCLDRIVFEFWRKFGTFFGGCVGRCLKVFGTVVQDLGRLFEDLLSNCCKHVLFGYIFFRLGFFLTQYGI